MAPELKRYLHSVSLDERLRSDIVFSDATKIRMYTDFDRTGIRLRGSYNRFSKKMEFPLDTDLTVTLPKWAPDAVKAWVGFSEISVLETGTTIGWRLNNGTNDYWYTGGSWQIISDPDHWNTEVEITDNIATFPHTQKEITPKANLRTTDKDVTPVLKGYGIAMDAQFDWWEDIIIRSLIPRLREDFNYITDYAALFTVGGTTFNMKTSEDFIPDQDMNITGIDAVYNHDTDAAHDTDIFSSYNVSSGLVTLTGAVSAETTLFMRLILQPKVVINYPHSDYIELGKTPSIIVDNVAIRGDQVLAQSEMVDKKTAGAVGYKTEAPFWAREVIVSGMLWAGKNIDAQRLLTKVHQFLVKGSSRAGHKPGGLLQSKALGVYYTMRQRSPFRHGPRAAITDLKSSTFQIVLSDVYVWLNDMADKPVVTDFNYAVSRRRDSGPDEEFGVTPDLTAGVINTLYQQPEIEEP